MEAASVFKKLHIFKEYTDYNLSLWECPSFVFSLLGLFNIMLMLATYFIAGRYTDTPELVALLVIVVTAVFFVISHIITKSYDKLAQANIMKTEFVSVASHQLRAPLSAMRWTINLITDGRIKAEDTANYIETLKESNERMVRLVSGLLDVSRIEMGKMILSPVRTNILPAAKKIAESFKAYAQANNAQLVFEAPENLPDVFADPEKISMVIQNLIDNAIKYTKKGTVRIALDLNGRNVRFSVQDQGVGIPEDQQKHIFKKFFRSDNVMKHQTIGTGLGLFIAKSVIDESGGKIGFRSKEGEGTTFYFTLPIYK